MCPMYAERAVRGVWWWTSWIMTHINLHHPITHTHTRCAGKYAIAKYHIAKIFAFVLQMLVCGDKRDFDISSKINLKWLLLRCTKLCCKSDTPKSEMLRLQQIQHQTQTVLCWLSLSLPLSIRHLIQSIISHSPHPCPGEGNYLIGNGSREWPDSSHIRFSHTWDHLNCWKLFLWNTAVFTKHWKWVEQRLCGVW